MNINQSAIAAQLGVTRAAVSQWFAAGSRPPLDRCPAIERATGGRVTCEELRGDVQWARVPDPNWPHPGGRPCLDVAAPVAAEQ